VPSFADLNKDSEWPPTRNGMPELTEDYPVTLFARDIVTPDIGSRRVRRKRPLLAFRRTAS